MSAVFTDNNKGKIERTRCEIYTRVMGYHRPVTSFNIGKKAEFYSRNYFKESNANTEFSKNYTS